ncbi:MAG: alpha-glucosidase C-terminal domain-containing protein [Acidobacteria bacterium]|nr:alpha-glucosidase C-terminal domain-containing protein [Acidobacteriota bacterium]
MPATPAVRVQPQSEWAEAVLYFVVLDRYADGDPDNDTGVDRDAKGAFHGGDLVGLRERLDDLADLGITALWITPVVKNIDGFVTGAGFPDWGYHGYWADDFYRVDPRFGTEAELKQLVDDAHAHGIAVLLDVVYNHAGYDSRYLTDPKTRGWLRSEDQGTCGSDDLTSCLSGLPDFRTELPEVRDFLLEAHLGRAERVGLDGFRLDTVKHVSHDFWQEHRRRTRERLGDDFFLVGEVWGGDAKSLDPWFETDEMDAGFDFSFQGSTLGFVQGRGRPVAYDRYLEKRHEVREGHLLAHFLGSHDTPTALYQLGGDVALFRLAALLQLTTAGIPTIYYGEEVGRVGGDWPENRSDMPWGATGVEPGAGDPRDEALRGFYKQLISIRRAHPALWRGDHHGLAFGTDQLAFARSDADETVVVAVNRAAEAGTLAVASPAAWSGAGAVVDLLTGERFELTPGAELELPLAALSGRILAVEDTASTRTRLDKE